MIIEMSRGRFYTRTQVPGWPRTADGISETTNPLDVVPYMDKLAPWCAVRLKYRGSGEVRRTFMDEKALAPYVPPGCVLDAYQQESVGYALTGDDTLLGDDAGLGKTVISIICLNAWDARRIVIVSPSSVKYNWKKELQKWRVTAEPDSIHVVEGDDWNDDANVVIINYDLLSRHADKLHASEWDAAIYDESHRLTNKKAQRTKLVFGHGGRPKVLPIKARKRISASATPMNRPIHLWTHCKAYDPNGLGKEWLDFVKRYCAGYKTAFGWDDKGASHLDELAYRLRASFFIRHDDSVINLPPYVEQSIVIPRTTRVKDTQVEMLMRVLGMASVLEDDTVAEKAKELRAAIESAAGNVTVQDAEIEHALRLIGETLAEQTSSLNIAKPMFEEMSLYRKIIGEEKVSHAVSYISMVLDRSETEPLLIFCHHKEVVKGIAEGLRKSGVKFDVITGDVSSKKKDEVKEAFQAGEIRVIIANMAAGGEGLTLTASNHVLFIETDWNASTIRQCLKRIHRRTQTRPCLVEYLLMDATVDMYVTNVFLGKRAVIDEVVG